MNEFEEYKAFVVHLEIAHIHAQRALDALYSPSGPKRRFWYRWRLGRAQSALIGLHMKELQRIRENASSN